MKFLQKLGKALMLPVAVLPICGILMGIGYWLCPATMQGGDIHGAANLIGLFLVKAGGALIDNMAILFAIGVGVGMSEKNDGTGGIAALASWLMLTTLLSTGFVTTIMPSIADNATKTLAFDKIANPFIGILAGIIGSTCYNKFKSTKLPDWLSFFSGKRCVAIIAGVVSIIVSAVLLFVWPLLFSALVALGKAVAGMDVVGAGIYAFLNRLLIPTGLHHALNNVFWFDTIGLGDLQHFWAGETSADVSWSLGMYMSGFFPCMMFGIPGAALAMVRCAKPAKKKVAIGLVASAAICAFICGVTEPFEFGFMFLAPGLYVIYALLYGIFTMITVALGFRAGFSFSAGAMDLLFSSSLPAAQKTWLILPLGIAAFIVFYVVFLFAIKKFDLKTPGREDDDVETKLYTKADVNARKEGQKTSETGSKDAVSEMITEGLGGKKNISDVDCCATRLRITVYDTERVNDEILKQTGSRGIVKKGQGVQIIYGPHVTVIKSNLEDYLETAPDTYAETTVLENTESKTEETTVSENAENETKAKSTIIISSPITGNADDLSAVPDEAFAGRMMGDGAAVTPTDAIITAPEDGEVAFVFDTKHAIGFETESGVELLIHVGVDTVSLNGEGFEVFVENGQKVKKGDAMMKINIPYLTEHAPSLCSPVLCTDLDDNQKIRLLAKGEIKAGEPLFAIDAY